MLDVFGIDCFDLEVRFLEGPVKIGNVLLTALGLVENFMDNVLGWNPGRLLVKSFLFF